MQEGSQVLVMRGCEGCPQEPPCLGSTGGPAHPQGDWSISRLLGRVGGAKGVLYQEIKSQASPTMFRGKMSELPKT